MTTLTQAHNEWSRRAPDERFSSLEDLHGAVMARYQHNATKEVATHKLHAVAAPSGDHVQIGGPNGTPYPVTSWAFSQLARIADAPPSYLTSLPARLAADCINHGMNAIESDRNSRVLFQNVADGQRPTIRAITSRSYSRIWDADITSRLLRLAEGGVWQPAPAAFDGSRGLYAGDRDMFAFMVDNGRRIFETLPGGGLSRGFFVWNSEVGARSFGLQTFLYEYVCGNHRVWGASEVKQITLRHVGDVNDKAFGNLSAQLIEYANSSSADDEAKIERMRTVELGPDKNAILDRLFGMRALMLTKGTIRDALELSEKREEWYGNPRSAWAIAGALTEIARDLPNADERVALDTASAKVMALAF